jgi:hypothetical protein
VFGVATIAHNEDLSMTGNDRNRVIFHSAVVLLVGLFCGLPAVTEWGSAIRLWQSAHFGLIVTGVWLLAMAAVLPSLVLAKREASALMWSLILGGYGFMVALVIEAFTGVRGITPAGPVANWIAFAGNTAALFGSVVGTALTLLGARAALKANRVGSTAA